MSLHAERSAGRMDACGRCLDEEMNMKAVAIEPCFRVKKRISFARR